MLCILAMKAALILGMTEKGGPEAEGLPDGGKKDSSEGTRTHDELRACLNLSKD